MAHQPTQRLFKRLFQRLSNGSYNGSYNGSLRSPPQAFFVFIIAWPLLTYYPVAHWVWGAGWLARLGVIDFAGGITIHTVAGTAGLVVSRITNGSF